MFFTTQRRQPLERARDRDAAVLRILPLLFALIFCAVLMIEGWDIWWRLWPLRDACRAHFCSHRCPRCCCCCCCCCCCSVSSPLQQFQQNLSAMTTPNTAAMQKAMTNLAPLPFRAQASLHRGSSSQFLFEAQVCIPSCPASQPFSHARHLPCRASAPAA